MPERPPAPGDEFADDTSIGDDVQILRRIPPKRWYHADDERPHSDNFANSPDGSGTSFDIMVSADAIAAAVSSLPEGFGAVVLKASDIRAARLGLVRDPLPDNPHHVLLQGKKTEGTRKSLCRACRQSWAKKPDK